MMTILYIVLTALYLLITHKFSKAVVADMVKHGVVKEGVFLSVTVWLLSLFWPVWILIGIADFLMSEVILPYIEMFSLEKRSIN